MTPKNILLLIILLGVIPFSLAVDVWDRPLIYGVNGTNGMNGLNGTNGLNGLNGTNGVNGTNGLNGTTFYVGDGYLYNISNTIYFNDSSFYNTTEIDALLPIQYTLYYTNTSSNLTNHYLMTSLYPTSNTTERTYTTVANGENIINFTSSNNTGFRFINQGQILSRMHTKKVSGNKEASLYFTFSILHTSNNTEELVCTSMNSPIAVSSYTELTSSCSNTRRDVHDDDVFITRIYTTVTGSGLAPTISIMYDDRMGCGTDLPVTRIPLTEYDPVWLSDKPSYVSYITFNWMNLTFKPFNTTSQDFVISSGVLGLNYTLLDARYRSTNIILYFYNTSSSLNTSYTVMNTSVNPTRQVKQFVSLSTGTNNLTQRVYSGNITTLSSGSYHQHTTVNLTGGTKTLRINSKLYKVNTTSWIESEIGSSIGSDTLVSGYQDVDWTGTILSDSQFATDEKLVMRLFGVVAGLGTDVNFDVVVGGNRGASLELGTAVVTQPITDTSNLVPYTNATGHVNLGVYNLTTPSVIVTDKIQNTKWKWYLNATYWDCWNGSGTIENRGNTTLTC